MTYIVVRRYESHYNIKYMILPIDYYLVPIVIIISPKEFQNMI